MNGLFAKILIPLAVGGVCFALYRLLMRDEAILSPGVAEKLPLSKDLRTIPDVEGNYDIDGVSFDSEGVVIGSAPP